MGRLVSRVWGIGKSMGHDFELAQRRGVQEEEYKTDDTV